MATQIEQLADDRVKLTVDVPAGDVHHAGVEIDERDFVCADGFLRTSAPHIFAAGDVTGRMMLVPQAIQQGFVAATNAVHGATMDAASNSGGIFDLGEIYIELYLDDLKSVLIGDGWTNTERNYGKYALPYNSFLDTGFKQQFRDGGNQVQHAMAGIYISNVFGLAGRVFAHWQEDEDADLALYDATFTIGRDLDGHKSNFTKLPNMIRTRLAA